MKSRDELYPDLSAVGGLANALESALKEIGSSLTVSKPDERSRFVNHARVEWNSRLSQVFIAAQERMFLFDFWARGVMLAEAQTPDLLEAARSIDMWVTSNCRANELASAFPFVSVLEKAAYFERGEEVEWTWQIYLQDTGIPELNPLVEAASRRSRLRSLFPFTSLDVLCFSRCTGHPYTNDVPCGRAVAGEPGTYEVLNRAGLVFGRGNADEAAAMIEANLPPNCVPAAPGTADELRGSTPIDEKAR